jgi:hypothetical protein
MIPGTAVKSEDLSHTTVTDQNEPPPLTKHPRFFLTKRTNNDVEGWHRRLNKKACDLTPPFYDLVTFLHAEASLLPMLKVGARFDLLPLCVTDLLI